MKWYWETDSLPFRTFSMENYKTGLHYEIHLNIFLLELIFILLIFPPSSYPTAVFLSCRPLDVNRTFSTGLADVENVVVTTKGLQERYTTAGWEK